MATWCSTDLYCSQQTAIFALGCNVAVREAQLRRHYCYLKTKSNPRSGGASRLANFWSPRANMEDRNNNIEKENGNEIQRCTPWLQIIAGTRHTLDLKCTEGCSKMITENSRADRRHANL